MSATSLQREIRRFLTPRQQSGDDLGSLYENGSGYGSEFEYGEDCGNGTGDRFGRGNGEGAAHGEGRKDGFGLGNGVWDEDNDDLLDIKEINGNEIHFLVGWRPVVIKSVRKNYAKGFFFTDAFKQKRCFLARFGNTIARGKTLREARRNAKGVSIQSRPVSRRIKAFLREFPDFNAPAPLEELLFWHNLLTFSSVMGQREICEKNGLDPKRDMLSPLQFCEITKERGEGGEIIRKLLSAYKERENK